MISLRAYNVTASSPITGTFVNAIRVVGEQGVHGGDLVQNQATTASIC